MNLDMHLSISVDYLGIFENMQNFAIQPTKTAHRIHFVRMVRPNHWWERHRDGRHLKQRGYFLLLSFMPPSKWRHKK